MKLSVFTTRGWLGWTPEQSGYAYDEAVANYLDFADEVVVVWGGGEHAVPQYDDPRVRVVCSPWPYEFHWSEIAKHFNVGLAACTGDWVLKMDIDYFIHEKDYNELYRKLREANANDAIVGWLVKYNILRRDLAYRKVPVPFAINRHYRHLVGFGVPEDNPHSAWGYPILLNGKMHENGLPMGTAIPEEKVYGLGVDVYNYDNTFRTKEETGKHFLRFSQARKRAGFPTWGDTEEECLSFFTTMMDARMKKVRGVVKQLALADHPKHIRERIRNLTPDQFGHNQWKP